MLRLGEKWASQVATVVKNPPAHAGDIEDLGSIAGSGSSPGGGNGNPFQDSRLENPMDRGAWRATVPGAAQSQTRLKRASTQRELTRWSLLDWEGSQWVTWDQKPTRSCAGSARLCTDLTPEFQLQAVFHDRRTGGRGVERHSSAEILLILFKFISLVGKNKYFEKLNPDL